MDRDHSKFMIGIKHNKDCEYNMITASLKNYFPINNFLEVRERQQNKDRFKEILEDHVNNGVDNIYICPGNEIIKSYKTYSSLFYDISTWVQKTLEARICEKIAN